jgi:hypothetical protein
MLRTANSRAARRRYHPAPRVRRITTSVTWPGNESTELGIYSSLGGTDVTATDFYTMIVVDVGGNHDATDPDRRGGSCQHRFTSSCPGRWTTDWTGQHCAGEPASFPSDAGAASVGRRIIGGDAGPYAVSAPHIVAAQCNRFKSQPEWGASAT